MKFKSKILFIVILIIAFFIIVSLIFNIISLMNRGQKEILSYRETEQKKIENNLKNFVNIAYTILETNYSNAKEKDKLIKFSGSRLRNNIDIVEAILNEKNEKVKRGSLPLSEAKKQAIELIKQIRYNNGKGYFWIITDETPFPTMILESAFEEYNGTVLDSVKFNNANGSTKNVFVACVEACDSLGEGFVDYRWLVPTNGGLSAKNQVEDQKFSYVRLFKDWGWIIGTGIYIEDAIKEAVEKSISDLRTIRYDEGKGYFWINDDTQPTPRLIMNPTWLAGEGKIHTNKELNVAFGQDWNLYEAFLAKSKEGDGGFVSYRWKKETKNETKYDVPKQSYVKYFKDLGWVVGSGVYIDDIDAEIEVKTQEMQKTRTRMIINYLIISFIVAGIAIMILLYYMNKHFKVHGTIESDKKEKRKVNLLEKYAKDITPNANAAAAKPKTTQTDEEVSTLIKVFAEEQTKLIAFSKLVDKADNGSINIEKLVEQLKELSNQIKESADKIVKSHNDNA